MDEKKLHNHHIHEECSDPNCTEHHHHHHHDDECDDPNCHEHHHHHHDDECDDPNCHEHHHHHHDEDECDDPNCHEHHHHHNKHEDLVKDSLVMSCTRSFTPAAPLAPADLRKMGEATFLRLGDMVSMEGVVAGHVKGVIETKDGSIAFSLTRAGVVDVIELNGWKNITSVDGYSMTVNIMSLIPADITEEDIFADMK